MIFSFKNRGEFNTKSNEPLVFHISPFILNEKITIQQGTFLCPWDVSSSFEHNLIGNLKRFSMSLLKQDKSEQNQEQEAKRLGKEFIKKFVIKINRKERREIIHALHRMNINRATLFPGLDGFANSLGIRMEMTIVG